MSTCTGPGPDGTVCGRPHSALGLCGTHWAQAKYIGELRVIGARPTIQAELPCPGPAAGGGTCGRPCSYRGLCKVHAGHLGKWGELRIIGKSTSKGRQGCDTPGCDRPHYGHGLCRRCHNAKHKPPAKRFCEFPDCGRRHKARGYCETHYTQLKLGLDLRAVIPADARPKISRFPCPGPGFNGEPCGRPQDHRGLCRQHAAMDRAGKPLAPIRPRGERQATPAAKPRKAKPVSTLPDGWHKPTVRPRPKPSVETALERVDTLLRVPVLDPQTITAARSKLIRWGAGDLLEMLGLDAA